MGDKKYGSIAPGFSLVKKGYSPQEVDEYIDRIIHEHVRVCTLYQTYIQGLEEERELYVPRSAPSSNSGEGNVREENVFPAIFVPQANDTKDTLAQSSISKQKQTNKRGKGRNRSRGQSSVQGQSQSQGQGARKFIVGDVLFYVGLIIAVVLLLSIYGGNTGAPRSVLGFSVMRVLTPSMQDVIPKDSLVIMHEVDPKTLKVGDDITFLRDANTTITHRIVAIQENYANTGEPGFQTKGTMNAVADRDMVGAQNVVGKVVFSNLPLGQVTGFIKEYALWIALFTALSIAFVASLRIVFAKEDEPANKPPPKRTFGKKAKAASGSTQKKIMT